MLAWLCTIGLGEPATLARLMAGWVVGGVAFALTDRAEPGPGPSDKPYVGLHTPDTDASE